MPIQPWAPRPIGAHADQDMAAVTNVVAMSTASRADRPPSTESDRHVQKPTTCARAARRRRRAAPRTELPSSSASTIRSFDARRAARFFRGFADLNDAGPIDLAEVAALAEDFGLPYAKPDWLDDVIARYGLTPPPTPAR